MIQSVCKKMIIIFQNVVPIIKDGSHYIMIPFQTV